MGGGVVIYILPNCSYGVWLWIAVYSSNWVIKHLKVSCAVLQCDIYDEAGALLIC